MLSVLIQAKDGEEERLARTLAALVPAAVDGTVREVIVVAPETAEGVAAVAEHAGCRVEAQITSAAGSAKGDWLLFLEAGARPLDGWSEAVAFHIAGKGGAARFTRDVSAWQAMTGFFSARSPFGSGLLVSRREAAGVIGNKTASGRPARSIKPRRLAARIAPAG